MNVNKVVYTLEGHIDSAIADQATIDADVSTKITDIDALFQTFVSAASAAGGPLTSLVANRRAYPSNAGGKHEPVSHEDFTA